VEVFPKYQKGLRDLDGFSYIFLIYQFHLSKEYSLLTKPFLEDKKHGIFATRAPQRPNPIGMSIVKLKKIKGNKLYINEVNIIDKPPPLCGGEDVIYHNKERIVTRLKTSPVKYKENLRICS
jgi:tRNA (adenine37-N6)-methyltransferase